MTIITISIVTLRGIINDFFCVWYNKHAYKHRIRHKIADCYLFLSSISTLLPNFLGDASRIKLAKRRDCGVEQLVRSIGVET